MGGLFLNLGNFQRYKITLVFNCLVLKHKRESQVAAVVLNFETAYFHLNVRMEFVLVETDVQFFEISRQIPIYSVLDTGLPDSCPAV